MATGSLFSAYTSAYNATPRPITLAPYAPLNIDRPNLVADRTLAGQKNWFEMRPEERLAPTSCTAARTALPHPVQKVVRSGVPTKNHPPPPDAPTNARPWVCRKYTFKGRSEIGPPFMPAICGIPQDCLERGAALSARPTSEVKLCRLENPDEAAGSPLGRPDRNQRLSGPPTLVSGIRRATQRRAGSQRQTGFAPYTRSYPSDSPRIHGLRRKASSSALRSASMCEIGPRPPQN